MGIIESTNLKASMDKVETRFSCLVWLDLGAHERSPLTGFVSLKYVHSIVLYVAVFLPFDFDMSTTERKGGPM